MSHGACIFFRILRRFGHKVLFFSPFYQVYLVFVKSALVESLDKICTRYKMEISAEKTKLMTSKER